MKILLNVSRELLPHLLEGKEQRDVLLTRFVELPDGSFDLVVEKLAEPIPRNGGGGGVKPSQRAPGVPEAGQASARANPEKQVGASPGGV